MPEKKQNRSKSTTRKVPQNNSREMSASMHYSSSSKSSGGYSANKTLRTIAFAFSIIAVVTYASALIYYIWCCTLVGSVANDFVAGGGVITLAYVLPFLLIFAVLTGVAILFLCLNIKARKDNDQHIALGVFQIIFGSLISGILVLCSGGKPRA